MTARSDATKQRAAMRALIEFFEKNPPKFDMKKIRAAIVEHDKTCGLCRYMRSLNDR